MAPHQTHDTSTSIIFIPSSTPACRCRGLTGGCSTWSCRREFGSKILSGPKHWAGLEKKACPPNDRRLFTCVSAVLLREKRDYS